MTKSSAEDVHEWLHPGECWPEFSSFFLSCKKKSVPASFSSSLWHFGITSPNGYFLAITRTPWTFRHTSALNYLVSLSLSISICIIIIVAVVSITITAEQKSLASHLFIPDDLFSLVPFIYLSYHKNSQIERTHVYHVTIFIHIHFNDFQSLRFHTSFFFLFVYHTSCNWVSTSTMFSFFKKKFFVESLFISASSRVRIRFYCVMFF